METPDFEDQLTQEFHSYLEEKGVVQRLVRALIALYEQADKPEDPVAFIYKQLSSNEGEEAALLAENKKLKTQNVLLTGNNEKLKQELAKHKGNIVAPK